MEHGTTGTLMVAHSGGVYQAQATNQYGCTAKSTVIEIHPAPPVGSVPSGCFSFCEMVEICLPVMPGVAAYQWFLNGEPMPAPLGQLPNPAFDQNGDYTLTLTTVHGCEAVSEVLSLTLEQPFGHINGQVWLDQNNNGAIDPADSLVAGVGVLLWGNGGLAGTSVSGPSGVFDFGEMAGNTYHLRLDSTNLPVHWSPLIAAQTAELKGCGDTVSVAFLLKDHCSLPIVEHLYLTACEGSAAHFYGTAITAGSTEIFVFPNAFGCDSTVMVSVTALPHSSANLQVERCPGLPLEFFGETIMPGEQQDFIFQNQYGCDSVVTISVIELAQHFNQVDLAVCKGESVVFEGQTLTSGQQMDFIFKNQHGCDSIITVHVLENAPDTTHLTIMTCTGELVEYQGTPIPLGGQVAWTGTNEHGCDSVVIATAQEWPAVGFEWTTEPTCPGTADGVIGITALQGTAPFFCSLDGSDFQPSLVVGGLPVGSHNIRVRDANGCSLAQDFEIAQHPSLEVALTDYLLPCADPHITILPEIRSQAGDLHWLWHNGSTESWYLADRAGYFSFVVSDACSEMAAQVRVDWADDGPEAFFYMPDAFSPNGDGANEVFRAYPASGLEVVSFDLEILNRWGGLVYQSKELDAG